MRAARPRRVKPAKELGRRINSEVLGNAQELRINGGIMNKRIDVAAVPTVTGSLYPSPFDEPCRNKSRQGLSNVAGLTQFGVNLLRLQPGAWSSQPHWHSKEDEFVYVLTGEVVLVTDSGEKVLRAGDAAGFKAGDRNGHCLQNRSNLEAQVLEVGTRAEDDTTYCSDMDLVNRVSNLSLLPSWGVSLIFFPSRYRRSKTYPMMALRRPPSPGACCKALKLVRPDRSTMTASMSNTADCALRFAPLGHSEILPKLPIWLNSLGNSVRCDKMSG